MWKFEEIFRYFIYNSFKNIIEEFNFSWNNFSINVYFHQIIKYKIK